MITTNVDKIRAQIKLHGKTQTEVAKALGFLSTNLTRTINNSRITLADLNKLAEATGCNVVDFFMDNDRESGGQVFDWKLQSNTYQFNSGHVGLLVVMTGTSHQCGQYENGYQLFYLL